MFDLFDVKKMTTNNPFCPCQSSLVPSKATRNLAAAATGSAQAVKIKYKTNTEYYLKSILSGGIAGGIEICITMPTEYVKTQLQLDKGSGKTQYNGIVDCVKKTVREFGVRGLYRGLGSMILFSVPKSAVRFGGYDIVSKWVSGGTGKVTKFEALGCGLCAGVLEALFVVIPQETIKTKMIHDRNQPIPKYKGTINAVSTIIRQEGFSGIYKGVTATVMKQGTNQAVRFYVMYLLNNAYRGENDSKTIPFYLTFVFGGIAGASSVFANTPIDVIKTRMQGVDAHKYKSNWDCIKQVYRQTGLLGFYKGTVPRLGRVCADVAIVFTIKEQVVKFLNFVW